MELKTGELIEICKKEQTSESHLHSVRQRLLPLPEASQKVSVREESRETQTGGHWAQLRAGVLY